MQFIPFFALILAKIVASCNYQKELVP